MATSEAVAGPELGSTSTRETLTHAAPACLVAAGAILGLATAQGGYFSTSWGWASTAFLWLIGLWAVVSGRTEVGRLDLGFAGLLALFTTWIGLSIAWSVAPSLSVLELQRALVYVSGVVAVLLLARKQQLAWLVGTILAGITGIAAYALATRLFPNRFDGFDPVAVYRLSEPIGYWNGLGILCVLGLVIAVGVVADSTSGAARSLAAASTVIGAVALYFTYSRGAWLALAFGLAFALLVTTRRLHLVAAGLTVGLPAGVGALIASRSDALTNRTAELEGAVEEGRRLALVVVVLCLVAGLLGYLLHVVERRITIPRSARIAAVVALVALAVVAGAATVATYGGPATMAERAWNAFEAPPARNVDDLNSRLLTLSGNGRVELWRGASDIYDEHRVLGSGAGSFERLWRARPDATQRVRDAHGLYIETLAELGPLGLAVLVAALLVPVVAALRARRTPLVGGLVGAYVAFVLHAGVDWDWELTGVTLAALVTGAALVVAARGDGARLVSNPARVAVGVAAAVASLAAILAGLGNSALANSFSATERRELDAALVDAERARQLMPWSGRPWLARGEAEFAGGDVTGAEASFRRAIERDASDWRAWLDLALVTDGDARRAALQRARALYPRSTEIARTARELAAADNA
jgi:hypothetical protein